MHRHSYRCVIWHIVFVLVALATGVAPSRAADTLKIASPQRGSWEGAIPELGRQAGIFQKHGLDLEILYTAGGGETLQVVIAGSVDVGLSGGTLGVMGAFAKGAPVRIIGASSTGSREVYWFVPAKSPLQSISEASNRTLAYSTTGASSHIAVLRFIQTHNLTGAKPVATGDVASTMTQTVTGQVDVGWAVAPFGLDQLAKGEIRVIGRPHELPELAGQTIRVQITNARILAERREVFERYLKAYRETIEWMYTSPDAVMKYVAFSGFSEPAVRLTVKDFIPKDSLQIDRIMGLVDSMKDAVAFKFLTQPLTAQQLGELVQGPAIK